MRELRDIILERYVDFINNYLTINKFAEHNGLTVKQATAFLDLAQDIFDSKHTEE